MILCNRIDGASQNPTNLHAFDDSSFLELRFKLVGNTSHAIDRHLFMPVNSYIAFKEQAECSDEHLVDGRVVAVLDDERHQRRKEGIGGGLTVNTLDDVRERQTELIAKLLLEYLRECSFE